MEEDKQVKVKSEITKFDGFSNLNEMKSFAGELIKSRLIPFKTPEEAVAVALLGRDLGIGFSTAMNNIYNINGKPSMSVHLAAGLAKKLGVDWEIVRDGEALKDDSGKVVDMITEIRFYRFNTHLQRTITNMMTYKWSDAVKAGYTTKDNWKTKTRNMLRSRCLMEGIRFVAPEALVSIPYETTELLDSTTTHNYDTNEEGEVVSITDAKGNKIK